MATFIFTQDSLTGKTSTPTVYARIDEGKVRIYDTFDSLNGGTSTNDVKAFLEGLGGVGLRPDGEIDWSSTRVERYSWTQDFSTMPVSALPSRTTDKYVLYMGSNDLLGASNEFFSTTLGGLKTPSGLKVSEIVVDVNTPDPAGLDRLSVTVDQLNKIAKAGAKIANVTLSVVDSQAAVTTLLGTKPADIKALGNVAINLTPEQISKLIFDKKVTDAIVKGFTDVGVKVNMTVGSSSGLASLVANNTDLSSFGTLSVRLESDLVSATGPLASGTEEQQMARTEQLGEFISAFTGKSLSVDPGVLMKLVSTGVFWELQPEIGLLKNSIDVRIEASLDRLVSLQTPSDIYSATWGQGQSNFNLTIGDYNVTRALNIFADGLTIVSDNSGGSFTRDDQNDDLNINSKLLRIDQNSGFNNPQTGQLDRTSDGVLVHRYGGVLGEMFNRAYEQARNGGWWWGSSENEPAQSVDEAYATAIAQMRKVELKSSDGNLVVTADLAQAALNLGFRFTAADTVSVDLSANQLNTSKFDLVSTFNGWDWRTGSNKEFANAGKDGEVDTLADLKALGIRYRNWYNLGDIDGNGADDGGEVVFVPTTNCWVNKLDWMFGYNGTNPENTFWGNNVQSWLNGGSDQTFRLTNLHVGFADLDGDGLPDLPTDATSAQPVGFAFLRSLQLAGVDSLVSSSDIVIDLDPDNNEGQTYSLKAVVNFLKSTKLSFTRSDGQVAKISVDSDEPVALSYADISSLSSKGIALSNADGVGLITWAGTSEALLKAMSALTISDASALARAGVASIDVVDFKKLLLTADQAKAIAVAGLTFEANSYVVLSDKAANISLLSAAQISALGTMGLSAIDATDAAEIVLTDRQIRALIRADIVVDAGDSLRAKISDDYLLKALEEGGDLGQVLDQLASIGLDRISGTSSGLKMTAKMLADAMPMIASSANTGGLVKVTSADGKAADATKALTGIIVTYENDSELTFLPASRAALESMGAKFELAAVKTFGVAGATAGSAAPTVKVAVGQDIVFKAEDFLTQRSADGKTDQKLTDLSLVKDEDVFTVRIKLGELEDAASTPLQLSSDLIFDSLKPSGTDLNPFWGWNSPDGVPDAYQMYGWNAAPFERDWQRDWGGNDSNLPRFSFKYTDEIKALVTTADGEPLTFSVRAPSGSIFKFDVEVDRGRMDYINQPWAADGATDTTPYDSSDDEFTDTGDFVVFRVIDDAAFEAAIRGANLTLPQGWWGDNASQFQTHWYFLQNFMSMTTLTTKSVTSSELVTVTLDDITQDIQGSEYTIQLTGAQLKAGALVVTPNYGADGFDASGQPVLNISFEGGRGERTVLSFSSAVNGTDWWRRGEAEVLSQNDLGGVDPWTYASTHGGTVTYDQNGQLVVNLAQRELSLKIANLDMDGNGVVDANDQREVTLNTSSWTFDTYSAMNDLANVLSGNNAMFNQAPNGIDASERETLDRLQEFVEFSSDNGRLVVDYLMPGNQSSNTLTFSEVGMEKTQNGEVVGLDQDGVDVVRSELYVSTRTKHYFTVSSAAKLTAGDELKFTVSNAAGSSVSFTAKITADLVTKNSDPVKLLNEAIKAALTADLKIGSTTAISKATGSALTSAGDAVVLTVASNFQISVETMKEAGTLLVQQSSKDGAGGNVDATIAAVKYNKAPEVAYTSSEQELEGIFGTHAVNLSSLSVIDDSSSLQVTLSPTRGSHAGSFLFVDTSLFSHFIKEGTLKVQYFDSSNKLVDATGKLPVGVNKLVISASAYTFDTGAGSVTYKASDIVNLVISGVSFQLNRGLYSQDDKYVTEFGIAVNDDYTEATSGVALAGKFASSGERMYKASITHGTLEDATFDNKIDANDAIVKVSSMRQLVTSDSIDDIDQGLHLTDNVTDASQGIANDVAAAKVFTVTNKTLQHSFNSQIADMMVDQGLTTTSTIYLHADEALQYMPLNYAMAGFNTIYNETTDAMSMTATEANQLTSLGVGFVGDLEILCQSEGAETIVAPLRNLASLSSWDMSNDANGSADYFIKNFGQGDKLDLKTLLKVESTNLVKVDDESTALGSYDTSSSAAKMYWAFTDGQDGDYDLVDFYYVAYDQNLDEAATKAHFQIELVGMNYSASDATSGKIVKDLLV